MHNADCKRESARARARAREIVMGPMCYLEMVLEGRDTSLGVYKLDEELEARQDTP